MEKVKIECQLPKGRIYVKYEWRLTDEEKNEIRYILRNKARKEATIESFINYLQGLCALKKMLLEQPERSKVRMEREHILADCKAAFGHLKRIHFHDVVTWYDETLDPFWSHQAEQEKICPECQHPFTGLPWREKCLQCDPKPANVPHTTSKGEEDFLGQELDAAAEAIWPLDKFIKVLEKYHKAEARKIGRKMADNDHFIRKIRDIYIEHIGKPTTTENGTFFTLVQLVLERLGLPFTDPSKAIKAALKSK